MNVFKSAAAAFVLASGMALAQDPVIVGLITKTETNPFFVKMREGAQAKAATDNFRAGELIGQYARAQMGDTPPVVATLDLAPGITVGTLRHNGFMAGYGLADVTAETTEQTNSPEVVCSQDTQGDQTQGQTAMENCLTANPDINLVYTINEPAAFGAATAIRNAGLEDQVTVVSVDGGCAGVRGVQDGQIAATSQQYPLEMASLGVEAVAEYAETGTAPTGYVDTGVTLITDTPAEGVESEDSAFGLENCWGE